MNKQTILLTLGSFLSLFSVAGAQVTDVFSAEITIYTLIVRLEQLLWAIAVAAFFWGLVKFMSNAGDTAEHEKGKELIVWGLISFVVLISLWGIVQLIVGDTFGYFSSPVQYIDRNGTAY
jgi:thiamine transporter ThiT